MANVEALLTQIHTQGWDLIVDRGPADDDRHDQMRRAWVRLAFHAARVTDMVGAPEGLPEALDAVVDTPNAAGGSTDPHITTMGWAVGGLADLLADHRSELAAADPASTTRLQASVLAGLYAAAHATMSVAYWSDHRATVQEMKAITALTETAAMIPPDKLRSQLDWLTTPGPAATDVDGAVQDWRREATTVLGSPFLVTEYALRRVAGDISGMARVAIDILERARDAGTVEDKWMGDARAMLSVAADSWQQATAWPSHLRLGGRNVDLRRDSAQLNTALRGGPMTRLDPAAQVSVITAALRTATRVAAVHERATARLAARGGLWVASKHLPSTYFQDNPVVRWAPKPTGSSYGEELAQASTDAVRRLNAGVDALATVPVRRGWPVGHPEWETLAPDQQRPEQRDYPPLASRATSSGIAL